MIDTTDLLEILDRAHPSPLWAAIVEGLEKVTVKAELHGFRSDPTEKAVTAAYMAIVEAAGVASRPCCACDRLTSDHVICDHCRRELL